MSVLSRFMPEKEWPKKIEVVYEDFVGERSKPVDLYNGLLSFCDNDGHPLLEITYEDGRLTIVERALRIHLDE